jgi:hypothetical protein
MKESQLETSLKQAEAAYQDLVRTRASQGTMLVQAIRKGGGLTDFRRQMDELPLRIRSADIRRTQLKAVLLGRQLMKAQEDHHRTAEDLTRAGVALEEARKAYTQAVNVEQRSSLEVQRLEELHREELRHLEQLRSEAAERKEEEATS